MVKEKYPNRVCANFLPRFGTGCGLAVIGASGAGRPGRRSAWAGEMILASQAFLMPQAGFPQGRSKWDDQLKSLFFSILEAKQGKEDLTDVNTEGTIEARDAVSEKESFGCERDSVKYKMPLFQTLIAGVKKSS